MGTHAGPCGLREAAETLKPDLIFDDMRRLPGLLAARDMDDIYRAIDYLNLTAHWAQAKATDTQLEQVTDDLLMAMHDLRSVLVRKKADRLQD